MMTLRSHSFAAILLLSATAQTSNALGATTPEKVAGAHYQLATELAQARLNGETCDVDAYVPTILAQLAAAIARQPSRLGEAAASPLFKSVLVDNLAFQLLLADKPSGTVGVVQLAGILAGGIQVWGSASANGYSAILKFQAGGKAVLSTLEEAADGSFTMLDRKAEFSVLSGAGGAHRIRVEAEGLAAREFKLSYEVGEVQLIETSGDSSAGFSSSPSDCG